MSDLISVTVNIPDQAAATAAPPAVEIFDPPMCCPTGLCGPTLDQTLLDVNDMILALQAGGHPVERYQITSHRLKFVSNPEVMRLIHEKHMAALPITTVHGRIIKAGAYPILAEVQPYLIEEATTDFTDDTDFSEPNL